MTDALHDLGDSAAIGIAWYLQKVSQRDTTNHFTFGFKRFSLLGALINALILIGGSTFMLTKSIPELFDPSPTDGKGMLVLAIVGIIVNGIAALKVSKGNSLNQKMIYLHLLEDAAGWLATLAGAILLIAFDLPIIDPLLSILITIYILYQVITSLIDVFKIMLQGVPENVKVEELKDKIFKVSGVEDIIDFHHWSIDGENHIATIQILLSSSKSWKDQLRIKKAVRNILSENNTNHITIEFIPKENQEDHSYIKH